jgi:Zn-dependent M28 family amino/carboxypeptidase
MLKPRFLGGLALFARCLSVAALVLCLAPLLPAQDSSSTYPPADLLARVSADAIRAHMDFLSDDLLEGRGTGTRGYMLAAKYIATRFEALGLKPAGTGGTYFQPVRFRRIELDVEKSSVKVKRNGKEKTLVFGKDYAAPGNDLSPDVSVEAPLVFVGYGVTAPESNYDDYAGADVKGKVVVLLYGAPPSFPSAQRAHYSSREEKSGNAVAHGAVGIVTIWAGPRAEREPFEQAMRYFRAARLRWLDAKGRPNDAHPELRGSALLNTKVAEGLFEGSAKSLSQALADSKESKPQSFPLSASMSFHLVSHFTEVESPNIAAVLPGSDPKLKDEYVVYSAHADHLGIADPVNGDTIYNGAIDNASGTALILEIARVLSTLPTAPRRSILFLAVTGEEEGLLGSDAYAHSPTIPLAGIVANVNVDEPGAWFDFRDVIAYGAEHSSLEGVVNDVARHMDLTVTPDPIPEEVIFVRSDQYSFVKQGVPAVAMSQGFEAVDPKLNGKEIFFDWEKRFYHTPQDDMHQPYLDFTAAAKGARLNLAVGYEIAQQTERPHWNKGDFFEKFAEQGGTH